MDLKFDQNSSRDDYKKARQSRKDKKLDKIESELCEFSPEEDEESDEEKNQQKSSNLIKIPISKQGPPQHPQFKTPLPKKNWVSPNNTNKVPISQQQPNTDKSKTPDSHRNQKNYEEMAEYFGSKIEPFNMREEKEQLLIDDDGNLLRENIKKNEDPWLDLLDEKKEQIDDEKFETNLKKRDLKEQQQEAQQSFNEAKELKKLLAALLQDSTFFL